MQLEFAIKLMCYCELGHVEKMKFDTYVTILLEKENIGFPQGSFDSDQKIISASQINVGICFGVSAIVLDAAFDAAVVSRDPKQCNPNTDLRTLVYMVRCAFAHNPAMPVWEVRGDFARTLNLSLEGRSISLNMALLHGTEFSYDHIGGLATWFKVKNASAAILSGT